MNVDTRTAEVAGDAAVAAIYASFLLGDEEFALDVRHVHEVVNRPTVLTPMPLAPAFAAGVFNLRGAIVAVLDMRRLLARQDEQPAPAQAKVVIVEYHGARLGLMFDDTCRVLRPRGDERAVLAYADGSVHPVVCGVLKVDSALIRVLDLPRLLALQDIPHAQTAAGSAAAARVRRKHKRCISFRVGGSRLAFCISGIQAIVPAAGVEQSPIRDPLCAGVMRIRGSVVPVVPLARLLGAESADGRGDAADRRVIVLALGQAHVGLLVDAVDSIDAYSDEDLMTVPALSRNRAGLYTGCIDFGDRGHVFLLDSAQVLSADELARITGQHSALFTAADADSPGGRRRTAARLSYLWFDAGLAFALPMTEVREIVANSGDLIAMPGAPDHVCGMYNLRGALVTVVDVRCFYRLPVDPDTPPKNSKIIVLDQADTLLGLRVDDVCSILHIEADSKIGVPHLLRRTMPAAMRGDVSEIIPVNREGRASAHLLVLSVQRLLAGIESKQPDTVDA